MTKLRVIIRTASEEVVDSPLFSAVTGSQRRVDGPRPFPVGFSLALHGAILCLVAFGPLPSTKPQSMYQQLIQPNEKKLVWYKFQNKLPDVSPLGQLSKATPPKTEAKSEKQTIVSRPLNAPRGGQLVWQPAPKLKLEHEIPLPNLLAFKMPSIPPPPPKAEPKPFEPPPAVKKEVKKDVPAIPSLPDAPVLEARSDPKAPRRNSPNATNSRLMVPAPGP